MPRVRYTGPDPELKGTTALACEDVKWRIQLDRYPHQIGDTPPTVLRSAPDHWTQIVDEHVRVLILWNLPWLAAKVIDRHSDGYPCHPTWRYGL